jgi:hypothetical protein
MNDKLQMIGKEIKCYNEKKKKNPTFVHQLKRRDIIRKFRNSIRKMKQKN